MVEQAAGWAANVLPALQKQETMPIYLGIITLMGTIFSSAIDMPEFMRQVCTPNVPKFTQALLGLVNNQKSPTELKIACLRTVADLLLLYPNAHRSLQASLTSTCITILQGAWPSPTDASLLRHGAALMAMISATGGKVGAAEIWKRTVLGALRVAVDSFHVLRGTTKIGGVSSILAELEPLPGMPVLPQDPLDAMPIALDRLRCMTELIDALFRYPAARPVPVPVGPIVQLSTLMLESTDASEAKEFFESTQRSVELALLPKLWGLGSDILSILCRTIRNYMMPYTFKLQRIILRQLERIKTREHTLPFLSALQALLASCVSPSEDQVAMIVQLVLPFLQISLETVTAPEETVETKKTGSKKRNRAHYEGDEVFQRTMEHVHVATIVHVANIIALLLKGPSFPSSFRVVTVRYLVNVLLLVRDMPLDKRDKASIWEAIWVALDAEWLNKGGTGGIAVNLAANVIGSEKAIEAALDMNERLERHIHPRLPPVLRNMPAYEMLGMQLPEGKHEKELATRLGLVDVGTPNTTSASIAVQSPVSNVVELRPPPSLSGTSFTMQDLRALPSTSIQPLHMARWAPSTANAAPPLSGHLSGDAMQVESVTSAGRTLLSVAPTASASSVDPAVAPSAGTSRLQDVTVHTPFPSSTRPTSTSVMTSSSLSETALVGRGTADVSTKIVDTAVTTASGVVALTSAEDNTPDASSTERVSSVWKGKQPEKPPYPYGPSGGSDDEPMPPLTLDPDTEDEEEDEDEDGE